MPGISSQRDLVLHLLQDHGIMRLSELREHGLGPPTVSRLVEDGPGNVCEGPSSETLHKNGRERLQQ